MKSSFLRTAFTVFVMLLIFSGCRFYYEEKPKNTPIPVKSTSPTGGDQKAPVDKAQPGGPSAVPADEPLKPVFTSIRKKIFEPRCISCHSSGGSASGVLLVDYKDLMNSSRELVLPKNPDESGLYLAITREDGKRMPPPDRSKPLLENEIETIKKWIELGAPEQ